MVAGKKYDGLLPTEMRRLKQLEERGGPYISADGVSQYLLVEAQIGDHLAQLGVLIVVVG
jgi:hypothetical protein